VRRAYARADYWGGSELWTGGREDAGGRLRHPYAGSMTIVGSIAVLLGNRLSAGHFCLLEVCFGCAH